MQILTNHYYNTTKNNRAILLMVFYCCTLLLIRAKITHTIFLFFLVWNLFLALIPYITIYYLKEHPKLWKNALKKYTILLVWLLFLPNTFYIMTDFVHLSKSHSTTYWYDLNIIASFSIAGFYLGLQSLYTFEKMAKKMYNTKFVSLLVPTLCFLSGFGVYLGRVLRYNSWDIISNPFQLILDIIQELQCHKTLIFSFHFGIFIYLLHWAKKIIIKN